MKRIAQITELLERASKLGLWLSYQEIGLMTGLREDNAANLVQQIRRGGVDIDCRGDAPDFEYILRNPPERSGV